MLRVKSTLSLPSCITDHVDDHYPLPWQSLKYDTNLGGYRTGITETQLKGAPKYGNDNSWNWSDPAKTRSVNGYYGVAI